MVIFVKRICFFGHFGHTLTFIFIIAFVSSCAAVSDKFSALLYCVGCHQRVKGSPSLAAIFNNSALA